MLCDVRVLLLCLLLLRLRFCRHDSISHRPIISESKREFLSPAGIRDIYRSVSVARRFLLLFTSTELEEVRIRR